MATKAQITTNCPCNLKYHQPTRLSPQTHDKGQPNDRASAQNKPNFKNTKMNTTSFLVGLYEDFHPQTSEQNKANSKPNKANRSQFRALVESLDFADIIVKKTSRNRKKCLIVATMPAGFVKIVLKKENAYVFSGYVS